MTVERRSTPSDLELLPAGQAAGCWSSSAATTPRRRTRRRTRAHDAPGEPRAATMTLFDDRERRGARSGRSASPGSARPRASPGSADTWEGWEDSAVAPDRARRLPARLRRCRRVRLQRRALRPLRPGLRAHAQSTSTCSPRRACAHYRAFIERGGRPGRLATAARCRASTATARRAASCCRAMYGAGAGRGVPRVQGDLGSATAG